MKKDRVSGQVENIVMRRADMDGYKINNRLFNVDDGAYLDKVEFRFERVNRYFYCFMDDYTSYIYDRPDTKEVRDELVWANVKCWLKNKYGKNYYREYERTDL